MNTFIRPQAWHVNRGDSVLETLGSGHYDVVAEPTTSEEGADVWVLLEYLSEGEYDNMGAAGRSNMRVFEAEHAELFEGDDDTADAVIVLSAFSHRQVAVRWEAYDHRRGTGDREECDDATLARLERWDALADVVSALADYPILDESDWSECESEDEQEQWSDWGRFEFRRALCKAHPAKEEAIEALSDESLDQLYWTACEATGRYPEHSSEGPHFQIDRIVPSVDLSAAIG